MYQHGITNTKITTKNWKQKRRLDRRRCPRRQSQGRNRISGGKNLWDRWKWKLHYGNVYIPVGVARALAGFFYFWLLGEQSSQKCVIPCLERRWTTEKNLTPLALSSAEKSVTVQTNKQTRAHTNSKRYIHTFSIGMRGNEFSDITEMYTKIHCMKLLSCYGLRCTRTHAILCV